MPGILDTHVHITTGVAFEYAVLGEQIMVNSKKEALDFMSDYVAKNPGLDPYRFMLPRACLNGEELVKEDLDAICPDTGLVILEEECHSALQWPPRPGYALRWVHENISAFGGDPGNVHIVHGLLSEQYKAVLPIVGYYQFMDKYFTPSYLLDIVAEREKNS